MSPAATNYSRWILCCLLLLSRTMHGGVTQSREDRVISQKYKEMLKAEREGRSTKDHYESLAAGVAALFIGIYGYYNDNRGTLVKLAYGATQTAGVLMISDTIFKANQPSLLLTTDNFIKQRGSMSHENYEKAVVVVMQRKNRAELKQLAYSASILTGIYGYNGYREESKAVKNVFYFLAGNFLLVSAMSFYELSENEQLGFSGSVASTFKIALLPYPTLSWYF